MSLTIREATPEDASTIAAFNSAMAVETEGRALEPHLIGPGVAAILSDATKGRYWVAIIDGEIVGQIMVTYEWSDWRNGDLWWIQSVYVSEDHRRQGVFSGLYRHLESLARAAPGCCGIRLYVEEGNTNAQSTYHALGMIRPGYVVMEVDFRKQPDHGNKET